MLAKAQAVSALCCAAAPCQALARAHGKRVTAFLPAFANRRRFARTKPSHRPAMRMAVLARIDSALHWQPESVSSL